MTRRLLLIRHAEAGATPVRGTDHERSLSSHGVRQAREIGRLVASGVLPRPDIAITSDAARARQTWAEAATAGGLVEASPLRELYGASYDSLVDLIGGQRTTSRCWQWSAMPEVPSLASSVDHARAGGHGQLWLAARRGRVIEIEGPWSDFRTPAPGWCHQSSRADERLTLARAHASPAPRLLVLMPTRVAAKPGARPATRTARHSGPAYPADAT